MMITKATIAYLNKKYNETMNKKQIAYEFLMDTTEITAILGKGRIFKIEDVIKRLEEKI